MMVRRLKSFLLLSAAPRAAPRAAQRRTARRKTEELSAEAGPCASLEKARKYLSA
jgi:hypothetical protein